MTQIKNLDQQRARPETTSLSLVSEVNHNVSNLKLIKKPVQQFILMFRCSFEIYVSGCVQKEPVNVELYAVMTRSRLSITVGLELSDMYYQ